jgi:hypothetical protein
VSERERLDHIIVVRPARSDDKSYHSDLFESNQRTLPVALIEWDAQVNDWCDEYRRRHSPANILEVNVLTAVFVFDKSYERVVLAYGLSVKPKASRDRTRMRQFPDVNIGVRAVKGTDALPADRGHFLAHSAGGRLDVNLFPQSRALNRGLSPEGKLFRRMERYVVANPGVFHYHRAIYDDDTWIPSELEYGVLVDDEGWWVNRFENVLGRGE